MKTKQISNIRVLDHSHILENNYTKEDWYKMIDDLRRCVVKVPEWVYSHFLEAVPPIYPKNNIGFFNSEPLNHDRDGNPIYYYFFKFKDCFYGAITTIKTQEFLFQMAKASINNN